jgi:hypothetical protein
VGRKLVSKYEFVLAARAKMVEADAAVLQRLDSRLKLFKHDMSHDFRLQKARVDNELLQLCNRTVSSYRSPRHLAAKVAF